MTTATRTDIHRPTELDPEAYEFVACGDVGTTEEQGYYPKGEFASLFEQGYKPFSGAHRTHCTHCGARIRYYAVMAHAATMRYIYVGETCLENRFDQGLTKAAFQNLRTSASLNRDRMRMSVKVDQFVADNPEIGFLTYPEALDDEFMGNIASSLRRWGNLSTRQISAVVKAYSNQITRMNAATVREAEKAAGVAAGTIKPVPTGRVAITGRVLSLKERGTAFGFVLKMTLETDDGYKVWMTAPSSVLDTLEVGSTVSVTVTLTPSPDDAYFGFGSRPSKAQVV